MIDEGAKKKSGVVKSKFGASNNYCVFPCLWLEYKGVKY